MVVINACTMDRLGSQVSRIRVRLVLSLKSCYSFKSRLTKKDLVAGARLVFLLLNFIFSKIV